MPSRPWSVFIAANPHTYTVTIATPAQPYERPPRRPIEVTHPWNPVTLRGARRLAERMIRRQERLAARIAARQARVDS